MRKRMGELDGNRLGEAKRQFRRWRRGCRRPGRIPRELWVLAAEAAAEHGVEETASRLQLKVERLERWVEQLGPVGEAGELAGADFVELPSVSWGSPGECRVEVDNPSGRKIRIFLKGEAVAQLGAMLPALCGKDPAP